MENDLAAWLLEQIAEDERAVNCAQRYLASAPHPDNTIFFGPTRVLAECEAKRRRLAYLRQSPMFWDGFRDEPTPAGGVMLGIEALPFADRPGYQEQWRP